MSEQGRLTEEERHLITILGSAWNMFLKLNRVDSSDDTQDFKKAIHDAQRIVAYGVALRANGDILR